MYCIHQRLQRVQLFHYGSIYPRKFLETGHGEPAFIGYEIARQLGLAGFNIILTGRNKSRIESAARLLQQFNIKHIAVNAVSPGWVKTDMGGSGATRTVAQGAETVVWLATEATDNLTGKLFLDKLEIHW